jgi:sec-independent protein translocase protein TatA
MNPKDIIIIAILIIVLFGAKRLPELGRSLGQGIKEFKKSTKELADDEDEKKEKPESPSKS